jgi:hypothetical protein
MTTRTAKVCDLKQSGGTASPGFGFFIGDFFKIGDVRAGLREYVVQVVADADEGETFVEEFTDAAGAEKKKAEDDVIFAGVFDQALRGGVKFGGCVHVREFVFFVETHGHTEIVLAEEENVHAGHSGDFGDVLDAVGGFDLQRDDGVIVPVAGVAEENRQSVCQRWDILRS